VDEPEWARTSVTVWEGETAQQYEMSGATLADQLSEAEGLLSALSARILAERALDLSVRLFCSWTPADGQHAMTLPPGLVKELAAVDGTFWMDVYPSDPR